MKISDEKICLQNRVLRIITILTLNTPKCYLIYIINNIERLFNLASFLIIKEDPGFLKLISLLSLIKTKMLQDPLFK